jgi:hypothetical protein
MKVSLVTGLAREAKAVRRRMKMIPGVMRRSFSDLPSPSQRATVP